MASLPFRIRFEAMVDPATSERMPPEAPGQRMQRLRVGVTGLAAILLIVLLATAIASSVRRSATETAPGVAPPPVVATVAPPNGAGTVDANAEPLAQLGAAPGGAPDAGIPANGTIK